jgi:hypothetical protein
MNQNDDAQISSWFGEDPRVPDAQEFMARVNGKLARKRRVAIAIRVALFGGVLVVAAPILKGLLFSLLDIAGIPTP